MRFRTLAALLVMSAAIAAAPARDSGGRILFVREVGRNLWDLQALDADGATGPVALTGQAGMNSGAEISPDGRRIAFQSNRAGNLDVYVMAWDGSAPTRLTDHAGPDTDPTWSPDGSRIAFASDRDGGSAIFVMGADGHDPQRLTPPDLGGYRPAWSPDGRRIAFEAGGEPSQIFVMNADGSAVVRLTDTAGGNQQPDWSPDGHWIAFNSWRHRDRTGSDIWIMAPDGSGQRRLTSAEGLEEYPKWSPDGERILFTRNNAALFTMDRNGGDWRRLTEDRFFTAGEDWGYSVRSATAGSTRAARRAGT